MEMIVSAVKKWHKKVKDLEVNILPIERKLQHPKASQ